MAADSTSLRPSREREPLSVDEYAVGASFGFALLVLPLAILGWYVQGAVIGVAGAILALGIVGIAAGRIRITPVFWWLLLLTVVFSAGVMLLRGFFTGDGFAYWLPLARTLVEQGGLPAMTPTPIGYTSREPLYPLMLSIGLFFSDRMLAYAWIGPLFTALTLTILLRWAQDLLLPAVYRRWLLVLFFASPLVMFWSWNLLQESMILFYFTSFFYHADRFRKAGNKQDRALALASSGLAAITKFVGVLLVVPALFLFLKPSRRESWLPRLGILMLAYVPAALWFVRNAALYGSPAFPIFGSLFPSVYAYFVQFDQFLGSRDFTLGDRVVFSLRNVAFQLPIIFAGVAGLWRFRRYSYLVTLGMFAVAATTVLFSQTSVTRYYYPFVGVLLIFGLRYISRLKARIPSAILIAVSLWSLFSISVTKSTSVFIAGLEGIASFFLPVVDAIARFPLLIAAALSIVICLRTGRPETMRGLLMASLALGALHLRFVENKSWLATWPWIILFVVFLLYVVWRSSKALFPSALLQAYVLAVVMSVTWGMALTFGVVNNDISFNSVSRIYYSHERIADFIDQRENGKRDFFIVAEDAPYYVWNRKFQVLIFRSYNFNFQTGASYLEARTPEELRDSLRNARIRYIVDQGEEVADRYVGLPSNFLNAENTLMGVVRAHPDLFREVFTFEDQERDYTHKVYSL